MAAAVTATAALAVIPKGMVAVMAVGMAVGMAVAHAWSELGLVACTWFSAF